MDIMSLATELNLMGKFVYNVLYKWVLSWGIDGEVIGAFAVTVILFTLILKLATAPLDVWQKIIARSNSKKMEVMKPELDKINKLYANDRNMLAVKQREVYQKYKYSTFKACLPTIVTLVVFMVVFSGFNSAVKYHNSVVFDNLKTVYEETYASAYDQSVAEGRNAVESADIATEIAEKAVVDSYELERFLLTDNIFMPDTWKSPIPDVSTYAGSGMGKLGITEVDKTTYEKVMKPVIEEYNFNEKGKNAWNGYLILPILVGVLSIVSSKLIKPPEQPQVAGQTEEQVKMQQSQAKMMQYMMPLMMSVFSLFYSAAFSLYMFVSSLFSFIFNLVWNIIQKKQDAIERDLVMSTTVKKK
ncbi:MAG: membrane protein insertase YidC [Clostridia bacterium]|nr:membrane protein insertase YidC [Clostridia bacterium]